MAQSSLAVLIDADNASASIIEGVLEEIATLGVANVKRIYGDWSSPQLKSWKKVLLDYGLTPIQQFAYTTGKNATDAALIIDAMDLLYTQKFDGFCLISSDSDFTKLATRIKESGLKVIGFGEKKTPKAFMRACNQFIYTENLSCASSEESKNLPLKEDTFLIMMLKRAAQDSADFAGWSDLKRVRQHLSNRHPEFDTRNYGYRHFKQLIKDTDLFEFKEEDIGVNQGSSYIRLKRKKRQYEKRS